MALWVEPRLLFGPRQGLCVCCHLTLQTQFFSIAVCNYKAGKAQQNGGSGLKVAVPPHAVAILSSEVERRGDGSFCGGHSRVMEGVVSVFGRISFLVDQNTQAVHFFMTALLQLFGHGGMLYGELAGFVFRILGARRKSRKLDPTGSNRLPLPGPDTQRDQKLIEGPKSAQSGSWDNVWG